MWQHIWDLHLSVGEKVFRAILIYGFLVRHIDSAAAFLGLGIGMPLVLFALLMAYLRSRHVI